MDDGQIDSDPQQYKEEWFNAALSMGNEFELPKISADTLINRWLMDDNTNISQIQTSEATESALAAFATATATAATKLDLMVENCQIHTQIYSSLCPLVATNETSVRTSTQSDGRDNIPFPSNDLQTVASVIVSPDNFHSSSKSNRQFSGSSTSPQSDFSNQNLKGIIDDVNETNPLIDRIANSNSCNNSILLKNKETLVPIGNPNKTREEVIRNSIELNIPSQQLHADRKSTACCLHKLTMQINRSKSNEKMKENNETQSEYFEGDHKCFVCNVTFATGNALGGHMSSHAKKRKMEVMRNGGLSIFRSEEEEPPQQGSDENGSNQPPDESVASIDEPPKSNEEIEGNV